MNANTKLLHEIYYEAITAIAIISSILENQPDGKFFDILFGRMTEYRKIANETIMLLGDNQIQIKPQPVSDKFSLITMRKMAKTIKSKAVIKGLIIRGSVEGIKSVIECINTCTNAKKESRLLAYRLIEAEEENIRVLMENVI